MPKKYLPVQTRITSNDEKEKPRDLEREPYFVFLTSKKLVASYFWNGRTLIFICETRFVNQLEKSRRLQQRPGRRKSGKLGHKQGVDEKHSEVEIAMKDLFLLHLKSLKKVIPIRKLPYLYKSNLKILGDIANQDAIQSALHSQSFNSLQFIPVNILRNSRNHASNTSQLKKKIINQLVKHKTSPPRESAITPRRRIA